MSPHLLHPVAVVSAIKAVFSVFASSWLLISVRKRRTQPKPLDAKIAAHGGALASGALAASGGRSSEEATTFEGPTPMSGVARSAQTADDLDWDLGALEEAEEALRETTDDRRGRIGSDYHLWAVADSLTSGAARHAESLLVELDEMGVGKKVLFEPAFSPRAGRRMRQEGFYEIYIHRRDLDRVKLHFEDASGDHERSRMSYREAKLSQSKLS